MVIPSGFYLWLAWVGVGAGALMLHLRMVQLAMISTESRRWRIAAWLIPPVAPALVFKAGRKLLPIVWVIVLALYIALRFGPFA